MKNSEILINSISEWSTPIIQKAMQGLSGNDMMFSIVQNLISTEWLSKSIMNYLGLPFLKQMIEKIPEDSIPDFCMNLIDGMIDKRTKDGKLAIPAIGIALNTDAFRELKEICESNFSLYREDKKE